MVPYYYLELPLPPTPSLLILMTHIYFYSILFFTESKEQSHYPDAIDMLTVAKHSLTADKKPTKTYQNLRKPTKVMLSITVIIESV